MNFLKNYPKKSERILPQQVQKGKAQLQEAKQTQEAKGDPVSTASDSELVNTNKKGDPATSEASAEPTKKASQSSKKTIQKPQQYV